MISSISYALASIAAAFTAPLLGALDSMGGMPPQGEMRPPEMVAPIQPMTPPSPMMGQPPFTGGEMGGSQQQRPMMPPLPGQGGEQNMMPGQNQQGNFQPPMVDGGKMMPPSGGQPPFRGEFRGDERNQGFQGGNQPPMGEPPRMEKGGIFNFGGGQQFMFGRQQGGNEQHQPQGQPSPEMMGGGGGDRGPYNMGSGGGNQEEMMQIQQEEIEKRMAEEEKRMEAEEKRMQEQQLRMMKQGMKGLERGLSMMKKALDSLKKAGISFPPEDETTINELTAAMAVIKNATSMTDDVETAMETIGDKGQDLHEIGPRLEMLKQWPRILKSANQELSRMRKQFESAKNKAKRSKTDVSDIIAKIEADIVTIESAKKALEERAKTANEDFEDIMESMREEVFEPANDIRNDIMILQNISNISTELKRVDSILKNFDRRSAALKKLKKDTSKVDQLIVQAKEIRNRVQTIIKTPKFDPEDLFEAISTGEDLLNDIDQDLAELENKKTAIDKQFNFENPDFRVDSSAFGGER